MDWSEAWDEVVDRVSNGTSAGSTCIGKGGCTTDTGVGRADASVGAGAAGGGAGGGWEKKNEGPGL
jgi:hypothetical protein